MEVVLYPDPRLRRRNEPVERFDAELERLAAAMFEAMYRTKGVGLAAPQVGVNLRLLVYNPHGDPARKDAEQVLCNPRVLTRVKEREWGEEGCLSFPSIYAKIERPNGIRLEAQDLKGQPFTLELAGWDARIFQHELDHLDAILFIDRMTPSDRVRLKAQLDELVDQYKASQART